MDLSLFKKVELLKLNFDTHCSDLYLEVDDITKMLINTYEFKSNSSTFKSETDNKIMYDIPFAFPYYSLAKGNTYNKEIGSI